MNHDVDREAPAASLPAGIDARGLHHVGLAVRDLDAAVALYTGVFGARIELRATVADQGVEAVSLELPGSTTLVELVSPAPGAEGGGVARFLARRGEGMHHVAWSVADVAAALERLHLAGMRVVDHTPRIGLHGVPVAFLHPSATRGVLTELVQVAPG